MITYTCPTHGCQFDREGLPDSVMSCLCPECSQGINATRARVQFAHDAEHCIWRDWMGCGVPARGRNRTLDNWRPQGRVQEAAGKAIKRYASDLALHLAKGSGLTLFGPPGVGKTHILYGLVAAAFRSGIRARYIVWSDVVDRTKASFGSRENADRNLIDQLKRVPFLALDEIGVRAGTVFEQASLFELIDARYRDQLATIIASNLTAHTFDSIGERAADRLREANATVVVPGESQRAAAAVNRDLIEAAPALIEPALPDIRMPVCVNGEMVSWPVSIQEKRRD